jgi:hypothetical protein
MHSIYSVGKGKSLEPDRHHDRETGKTRLRLLPISWLGMPVWNGLLWVHCSNQSSPKAVVFSFQLLSI